jgi:hypothetical protein
MNPSRLLIKVLKYFQFWFRICWDIRLLVRSSHSNNRYRFTPCILSTWRGSFHIFSVYKQIHSAYPVNMYSEILFEALPYFVYSPYTYRFILRILRMRTDSFNIFSEIPLEDFPYSAYSTNMYKFISRILSNWTDSFRIFSVYIQIHSAYSENTLK